VRKRLVSAAACILALPLFFSASQSGQPTNPSPYVTTALAGHTHAGGWCECGGTPGCICDPGEIGNLNARPADQQKESTPGDPGAGVLMLALAFFLWTRMRA
jgi:hypothetical protein